MKNARRAVLASLALPALGAGQARATGATPCRVVGSSDPPYREYGKGGVGGLYYELLQAAAERARWPLQFLEAPSVRALLMMESGDADLMMGPLRTSEREAYLHYSRIELPAEDKAVFTRPGAPRVERLEQLEGLRLGVHRGKRYGSAFDRHPGLQRIELGDYDSALRMLALGRLDAVVAPERQARQTLQRFQLKLVQQPLRWPGETPYLVLAKRSPWRRRLAELEHGFDTLRQEGVWAQILARY